MAMDEDDLINDTMKEIRLGQRLTEKLKVTEPRKFLLGEPGVVIPPVPDAYLEFYKKSYDPKIVSIGPYHHGKINLRGMQKEKILCLRELLERSQTTLDDYIEAMCERYDAARRCYPESIKLNSDDFVEMMILDSAFIIVKFLKLSTEEGDSFRFNFGFEFALIKRDMLLLENQLPFFVLQKLFDLAFKTVPPPGNTDLISLAINFFNYPEKKRQSKIPQPEMVNHLLHLYKFECYSYSSIREPGRLSPFPGATKLKAMGVKFGVAPPGSILTDVTFGVDDQVMNIPRLLISEDTVALFLNFIAFEQANLNMGTHFTCYAAFMSQMLNEANDVESLGENGIIENSLGSHQAVVNLFRSMCEAVVIDPSSSIAETSSRVSEFSHRKLRILKADIRGSPWWSTYFRDPVTLALTLVGGIGLWLFTALQTFYSVYSYYHPS